MKEIVIACIALFWLYKDMKNRGKIEKLKEKIKLLKEPK